MKKSLVLASLLLVGSAASAMDTEYFVSAGVGSGSMDMKHKGTRDDTGATFASGTTSSSGSSYSIQGGVILDDNHKIGLDYSGYNVDGGSMYSIALGYDYRFVINKNWKPFIGASYAINNLSIDAYDKVEYHNSSETLTTNILSARVGVDYEINDNFFVTASYDYSLSTSGNVDATATDTGSGINYRTNYEMSKFSLARFMIGYKF